MKSIRRLFSGRLARNTSLALAWQLTRVAAQALWLLAIARKLGAHGYGTFAGVAGLATFLGAFSGLGFGLLLLRAVARDPGKLGAYWHRGLRTTISTGVLIVLTFLAIAMAARWTDLSIPALLAIGLSETVLFPVVTFCASAFNGHERSGFAAGIPALTALVRLVGAIVFLIGPFAATISTYSAVHLASTLVAAMAVIAITRITLRPGPPKGRLTSNELAEGFGYSCVWAVTNALTSLDKTLVLQLAGGTIAGLYASAYRLTTIFTLPVDALAMSALPRVFRHAHDPVATRRLVGVMFVSSVAFSVVAAVLLYISAAIIPWLLGPSFDRAVEGARMLVWLLPAYALRLLGGNTLLGLDGQWVRLTIEACGIGLLYAFGWAFLRNGELAGAAHMIVATEASLAAITWCVVGWRLRTRALHMS